MRARKNNIYPIEPKLYKSSYSLSDNNFNLSKEQNILNNSKKLINSFRSQYLNTSVDNNYDFINQENKELRKQIMELTSENKSLQSKLINDNFDHSSIIYSDNNQFNFFNMNDKSSEYAIKPERDINKSIPLKDQKFLDDSIDALIQTQINIESNKNDNIQRSHTNKMLRIDDSIDHSKKKRYMNKSYEQKITYKKRNNINSKKNNDNNFDNYLNIINSYNQLLEDFNNSQKKIEKLQKELDHKRSNSNKYQKLNNNYVDLQKRNKELIITIQKLKNDNIILAQYIEELNSQKSNLENNLVKLKKSSNNINNSEYTKELILIKNKYAELQKYLEELVKEKEEHDKNEKRKKFQLNQLINENNELKSSINNILKNEKEAKLDLNKKIEGEN